MGIDIDNSLIQIARKNIKYYTCLTSSVVTGIQKCDIGTDMDSNLTRLQFPNNVSFLHVSAYFDGLLGKHRNPVFNKKYSKQFVYV